ncbi:hypothetical protein VNI00_011991 [Paramarasmius palmivorus]|uniref:Uncharacterized protein n=1 Tax=Paramarasmius palmivorus TaxID=297713 RepID=A0AAW0C7S1_9AGAR
MPPSMFRRRDLVLFSLGAMAFYFTSNLLIQRDLVLVDNRVSVEETVTKPQVKFADTGVLVHTPGWTLFKNLYMSNGTLHIVTNEPSSKFPPLRHMISKSLWAYATPENIAAREPTPLEMDFVSLEEARARWDGHISTIEGTTILNNDPSQFLDHYYHFVGEYFFGLWAFLRGALAMNLISPKKSTSNHVFNSHLPQLFDRFMYTNVASEEWRDGLGFNGAAFRGEHCGFTQRTAAEAWEYMVKTGALDRQGRWWGDSRWVMLRYAGLMTNDEVFAEQLGEDHLVGTQVLLSGNPDSKQLRASMNVTLPLPTQMRIVYIDRQNGRRRLVQKYHEELVRALEELVLRKREEGKDWELDVIHAERLSKDEQLNFVSQATVGHTFSARSLDSHLLDPLGVHGNGLTHLVWMKPTPVSAVIELFYPGGFAKDYKWTTRALGMRHFAVWNDTALTYPNQPQYADYSEGFQGNYIPVHGPTIAKVVEDRLEGRTP